MLLGDTEGQPVTRLHLGRQGWKRNVQNAGEASKREAIGLGATRFEPKTIFVSCYVFFFVRVQRPPLLQSWQQRRASLDGV